VTWRLVAAALLFSVRAAWAQEDAGLRAARAWYDRVAYDSAVVTAQRTLMTPDLAAADRIALYELLGFAYAGMDSSVRAVESFRALIQLAPDREPDPLRVSPRITSQYQIALGQVLVARRLRVDSATFVAGDDSVLMRFDVSRAAAATTRLTGPVAVTLDSQTTAGAVTVHWNGLDALGRAAPPGRYQLVVSAASGRDAVERATGFTVTHAPLDTLPHLASLPGYQPQPELEQPPRNWSRLRLAASYVSVGLAAVLALRNTSLGGGATGGVLVVGAAGLATGFALSLQPPPARTVQTAVLYNQLLRDQVARRNEEIAGENAARRLKVMITVTPELQP